MTEKQFIAIACANAGITQTELAKRIGMTQSAFSQRLNNGTGFKVSEYQKIAEALGFKFQFGFINNNNEQVVHETL